MKLLYTCIPMMLVSLSLLSCDDSPFCSTGSDKNEGIIESTVPLSCWLTGNQKEFVIRDDSAYMQLFSDAHQCTPPEIDFTRYTLLGLYADGGCEASFARKVTRDDSEDSFHYTVKVKDCGDCESLQVSYNWVLVPRLPDGWTVTFEVR